MAFNKMFVMIPVVLLARKLDGEDPTTVNLLRYAYFSVQAIAVLVVAYTYINAIAVAAKFTQVIYVPPAPLPFADPNAKKRYTEIAYGAHVMSTARSLLGSTLFGICLTTGLHYYKGMIIGLAIQTLMTPFNLAENPLVVALVTGKGIRPEDSIFQEKSAGDLTDDDEVVDPSGNAVARVAANANGSTTKENVTFEDLLLDTWDAGTKANLGPLMAAIDKKNCNYRTKESGWTPIMVLSGLGAKGTASAIRQLKEVGANPAIVDAEGWNALHWAAFHGSVEAAKELRTDRGLFQVKDKEGKTPLEHAKSEGNDEVAKILEDALATQANTKTAEDGLRKRK